jgi:hypothetical protein
MIGISCIKIVSLTIRKSTYHIPVYRDIKFYTMLHENIFFDKIHQDF